jgi:hypothetical protein
MIPSGPKWRIYEFLDARGKGVIEEWLDTVDDDMRARFHQKLDLLAEHGPDLPPGLLAGTNYKHIDKLRIFGKGVTWRVMLCKGPISNETEFTILFIAQEKDRKTIPKDADRRADNNRRIIIADSSRRRLYEWNN